MTKGELVKKRIMMGKRELVKTLHDRQPSMNREEIAEVVDGTLALIVETVAKGGEVGLVGFGKFRPFSRSVRSGQAPGSERTVPVFTAGKSFREALEKREDFSSGDRC